MATYRFLRTFSPKSDPVVLAFLRGRIDDFLSIVEQLSTDRPFMIGEEPTIVDLSACAYLSFAADETGYDFRGSHPNVHAWLQRIAGLPGWEAPYDLLSGPRLPRFN